MTLREPTTVTRTETNPKRIVLTVIVVINLSQESPCSPFLRLVDIKQLHNYNGNILNGVLSKMNLFKLKVRIILVFIVYKQRTDILHVPLPFQKVFLS